MKLQIWDTAGLERFRTITSTWLTVLCLKVGNKNDDPERKVVETEDAYKFAGQMGIQLFETSAKENFNVEEMFNCITELVLRAKKDNLGNSSSSNRTMW